MLNAYHAFSDNADMASFRNPLDNRSLFTLTEIDDSNPETFDPDLDYVCKMDEYRLDAVVYEESYCFDDVNQRADFTIVARPGGMLQLNARGSYGQNIDRQEYYRQQALTALDALKGPWEIYDIAIRRASSSIDWELTESLQPEQVRTVADAHKIVLDLIRRRGDVPLEKIKAYYLRTGDYNINIDYRQLPMMFRMIGEVGARPTDSGYISISVGNIPDKTHRGFLHQLPKGVTHRGSMEQMWTMLDQILKAGPAWVPDYEVDMKQDQGPFGDGSSMTALREMGKKSAEKQALLSAEEKAQQKENRRQLNILTHLSDTFVAGVDVRSLLEEDPRFTPEEVDIIMARMGSCGMRKTEITQALSEVISRAIEPDDDEGLSSIQPSN